MLRRIRGVVGTALTWAAAWSLFGLGWNAWFDGRRIFTLLHTQPWFILRQVSAWALMGAIGGTVFAVAVSVASRRARTIGVLSMRRTAAWGALGGLVLPLGLLVTRRMVVPTLPWVLGLEALFGVLAVSVKEFSSRWRGCVGVRRRWKPMPLCNSVRRRRTSPRRVGMQLRGLPASNECGDRDRHAGDSCSSKGPPSRSESAQAWRSPARVRDAEGVVRGDLPAGGRVAARPVASHTKTLPYEITVYGIYPDKAQ